MVSYFYQRNLRAQKGMFRSSFYIMYETHWSTVLHVCQIVNVCWDSHKCWEIFPFKMYHSRVSIVLCIYRAVITVWRVHCMRGSTVFRMALQLSTLQDDSGERFRGEGVPCQSVWPQLSLQSALLCLLH